MKVKYIPSTVEVEHPIIGRKYLIDDKWICSPKFYSHSGYWYTRQRRRRAPTFITFAWHEPAYVFTDANLITPLYKRIYNATRRFMADRLFGWIPRRAKVFE